MAATTVFNGPFITIFDVNGDPVVGAKLTFFEAGTSTPTNIYSDSDLTLPWSQPIVTNAAGQTTGPVYCFLTPALKIVVVDADDVACPGFPMDNYSPSAVVA
jgi:hypothetical protein